MFQSSATPSLVVPKVKKPNRKLRVLQTAANTGMYIRDIFKEIKEIQKLPGLRYVKRLLILKHTNVA